jgi:type II secretory pathway pseudopilin PulG
MGHRCRGERGVTLIEVTLMLVVTAAIAGALAPVISETRRHAEITRAQTDMTAIVSALNTALTEMGFVRFSIDGAGNGTQVELLVSDGDIPRECTATPTGCGGGANSWDRPVDLTGGLVDFIENHIVANQPRANAANAYPTPNWKGPYLDAPVNPDPWGNRYMVNAQFFNISPTNVDVLSAGPDEAIQTVWSGGPLTAGGDDLVLLVQS